MVLDGSPIADSLASVEVDTDGVEEGEDSDDCESEGCEEGCRGRLSTKVEDRGGDGTDVDRVFKLWVLVRCLDAMGGGILTHERNVRSAAK